MRGRVARVLVPYQRGQLADAVIVQAFKGLSESSTSVFSMRLHYINTTHNSPKD